MGWLFLIAATAALAASDPQPPDGEQEESICVGGVRFYAPTVDEVRDLERTPVPASFRAAIADANDCLRWVALDRALLRFHLKYGDERSATQALAFLEWLALDQSTAPRSELRSAARRRAEMLAALQKSEAASEAATATESEWGAAPDFFRAQWNGQRPPEAALYFEAGLYLDAAEYFTSAKLLKKAAGLFERGETAAAITRAASPEQLPSLETARLAREAAERGELEERLVVLKARLVRDPDDIEDAHALVMRRYKPIFALDAEYAERNLDSVCDSDEPQYKDKIAGDAGSLELCDDPDRLHAMAQDFWRRLSLVEMLMAADSVNFRAMTEAEILAALGSGRAPVVSALTRRNRGAGSPDKRRFTAGMVVATLQGRNNFAHLARRLAFTAEERRFRFDDGRADQYALHVLDAGEILPREAGIASAAYYSDYEFNDDLRRALRLAAPFENPSLWRRLAEAYLATSDEIDPDRNVADEAEHRFVKDNLERLRCKPFCDGPPIVQSR